jgi:Glyoxalase-like domain
MARIKEIVVDALNPAGLARFWAAVLDDYAVRPYGERDLAKLASRGLTPETDPSVALDGSGPTLFFQLTRQSKVGRNRIHLDLRCDSRADEVARLQQLGASVRDVRATYTVMLDPEGNEFCVQDPHPR